MTQPQNQTAAEVTTERPTTNHTPGEFNALATVRLCDIPRRSIPARWGRWRLNRSNNTLEFHGDDGYLLYDISLADARRSSAACLDWIFQISRKTWMTNEDRANLLLAIQDVINPQANLCSWGIEQSGLKEARRGAQTRSETRVLAVELWGDRCELWGDC